MPKKIEQTSEQKKLYNELKLLVKKANQRLLRLERLTGLKGSFAGKQLYDYLNASNIQAISELGRIKLSKNYTVFKLIAIRTAVNQFLEPDASTVSGVKKIVKEYSEKAGKPINYKQASTLYIAGRNYTWIYEYLTKSEFWDFVKVAKENNWNKDTFIEQIRMLKDELNDESLTNDLEALYYYVMG